MTRRSVFIIAFIVATGAISLPVASVQADTFVVNSTADEVDAVIGNGVCATAGGTCTLRAAIQEANALPGPHQIDLPAGVFRITRPGADDTAVLGDLDITPQLTINGAGRDQTIIDGMGLDRVFHAVTGATLTIRDLTIQNGTTAVMGGGICHPGPGSVLTLARVRIAGCSSGGGGAVYHGPGDATIADCVFENNSATGSGGALFFGGSGALTILDTSFTANVASGTGGGVYYTGAAAVTMSGSTFVDCGGTAGGAAYVNSNAPLVVTDCSFESCFASNEGGAFYASGAPGLNPVLARCVFRGNDATGNGGALYLSGPSDIHLAACLIEDSRSGAAGGGLYYAGGGATTLEQCDFFANQAMGGSGGGFYGSFPGAFAAVDCRFVENTTSGSGGGVRLNGRSSNTVTGCYFADNKAFNSQGGGFCDTGGGPAGYTNTTFARNTAVSGAAFAAGGGLYSSIGSAVTLIGCTLSGNEASGAAAEGGGMFCSGPSAALTNTTFSSNVSGFCGGAIYAATGGTTITNLTFFGNAAASGGAAIWRAGPTFVQNTIIGHGLAGGSCGGAPIISGGHNIDQDGGCGFAAAGDLNGVDPRLGPLQNNGGPTQTHALLGGSPAINAGDLSLCWGTDQRGLPRAVGGTGCDIGAFEVVSDCNNNGQDDTAEVVSGATADCNHNGIPDSCDIAVGLSQDCDGNSVPDSCQVDSNGNGVIDACEPGPQPSAGPCGVCGMGVGMMMPFVLLGMAWMKRRTR
jgi:large repetitive protein